MARFISYFDSTGRFALGAAALLAIGGGVGAAVTHATQPAIVMAPPGAVSIASLATASRPLLGDPVVTVRGRVVEAYGDKFVISDGSGRALVETGPHGDGAGLIPLNQTVSVQGRYGDGVLHAQFLVEPDGQVAALDPHGGRHDERHGGHHGPDGDRPGPDDAPPPPPAASAPASASATPPADKTGA